MTEQIKKERSKKALSKKTLNIPFSSSGSNGSLELVHNIKVVSNGCKYFFNAQHKFLQLSTVERAYFDFLCEKMNSRNKVSFNPANRGAFINFCKDITSGKFDSKQNTLLNAEKKFVNLYLAFKDESGKLYYINPKHVFKGSNNERKKLYNSLSNLASEGKIPIEAIIDKPISVLEQTNKM